MKFLLFNISYQPVDDPLLRSITPTAGPFYKELFRPSQTHPNIYSARLTKYLIALLGKIKEYFIIKY